MNLKVKHQAVWVANLFNFIFAFIWYGPLFGGAWAKGAELVNPSPPSIWATITSFFIGLIFCYGLAILMKFSGLQGLQKGLLIGVFVSIAFLLQVVIGPWLFAGRFLLFAVNMPYFAITSMVSGAIIGAWQTTD